LKRPIIAMRSAKVGPSWLACVAFCKLAFCNSDANGRKAAGRAWFFLALSPLAALSHAEAGVGSAPQAGPCSLEEAAPVTVARVDPDLEILLDDGRRITLSGVEFPHFGGDARKLRDAATQRLSGWLSGRQAFLAELTGGRDRWGRVPARLFASGDQADSPLVGVGETLLAEGLARFRPDRLAAPCATFYVAAERVARERSLGLWANPDYALVHAGDAAAFRDRKGMVVAEGVVVSTGEAGGLIYLNFGPRRGVDFTVVILKRNSGVFEQAGFSPRQLNGRRVRIRGMIETSYGLRMELATPAEIELVDSPPAP
jgi:endonuclease YncB( thermonuclease family)